jgi:hypothetical protein
MLFKWKVDTFLGNTLLIKISIIFTLIIFDLVNGKGKDIKNLIYNWLVVCQMHALEDVALFDPNILYVLW